MATCTFGFAYNGVTVIDETDSGTDTTGFDYAFNGVSLVTREAAAPPVVGQNAIFFGAHFSWIVWILGIFSCLVGKVWIGNHG